jgi:hypothetical protein
VRDWYSASAVFGLAMIYELLSSYDSTAKCGEVWTCLCGEAGEVNDFYTLSSSSLIEVKIFDF